MKKSFAGWLAVAAVMAMGTAGAAHAQAWPSKPVRLITASPSSPQDVVARIVGQKLSELWKQSATVENRAGAGSLLSIQAAVKSPADGYNVLVSSSAYAITPALYPSAGFDAEKDLVAVRMLAVSPNVIVAAPTLNAQSLQEVFARAKKGEKMQHGSPGHGTGPALVMEYLVKIVANVDVPHVPYKGAVAPIAAATTGEVALATTGLAPALPFIRSGKVKALAVTTTRRSPALPDVPTLAEAGFPAFSDEQWVGAWVPAGTPQPIVDRLSEDLQKALQAEDVRTRLAGAGYEVSSMTREQFATYLRAELAKWAKIAKETGAKPE